MWRAEQLPTPENYLETMHFGRMRKRLIELQRKSDVFKQLISKATLTINHKKYANMLNLLIQLQKSSSMILPDYVSRWCHSDMHLSNIMIDEKNDNFILLDPRGYPYCDYYYDYGKLWHSIHGKYEMIAEKQFTFNESSFALNDNNVFYECEQLKKKMPKLLCKYSHDNKSVVMMKTMFNEAVHFCSLVPFILDYDGKEERAIVAYYTGVILLNEWCNKYIK
jgi:hypothetical protein